MNTDEQVLCVRATDLPRSWRPRAGALPMPSATLLATLDLVQPYWLPRTEAELDPDFKQWITYVLVRNPRGQLAAYPRQGNEKRLHGRWSLGIGGHINPEDAGARRKPSELAWWPWFWRGMQRELSEEFPGATSGLTRFLGLIHESRTAVGRVHIGAVFLHETAASDPAPGLELTGLAWVRPETLGTVDWPFERFELWSRLAFELLGREHEGHTDNTEQRYEARNSRH